MCHKRSLLIFGVCAVIAMVIMIVRVNWSRQIEISRVKEATRDALEAMGGQGSQSIPQEEENGTGPSTDDDAR